MGKIINTPIFITLLVLSSLFAYHQYNKNIAASEIRGVYEELLEISEDANNDLEKKKLVKRFIAEGISQVKEAFSEASTSTPGELSYEEKQKIKEDKQKLENENFFKVKQQITFTAPNIVEDNQYSNVKRKYVYKLTNNSNEYVKDLKHTIAFYEEGKLIDTEEEWGQVKLAPNESKAYSKSLRGDQKFDTIKITLDSISIIEMPEK